MENWESSLNQTKGTRVCIRSIGQSKRYIYVSLLYCSCVIETRSDYVTQIKFIKLLDWSAYSETTRQRKSPCQNSEPVSANRWEDQYKHCYAPMTPSKSFQNWPATIQANFRKICMELSERDGAYTDLPTCLHKQSDFWYRNRTFFMFFFLNMPTNPIISQILSFVTTQFSSLSFQEHMKNRCQTMNSVTYAPFTPKLKHV